MWFCCSKLKPLAWITVFTFVLMLQATGVAIEFPGQPSQWQGFTRYDFKVDTKPVLVVTPKEPAPGVPWVWHGEFFGHKPAPDIALLNKGFHVVYMRVPNMLGNPAAVKHWNYTDGQKLSFGGVVGKTLARLKFVCPAVQFQVTSRSSRGHTRERAQVFDLYQDVFFDRYCQPGCLIRDVAVIVFDDPTGCLCVC